jgi:hypothetical protein
LKGELPGEEADGRVQSAAGDHQERETGTRLLILDANPASFVKLAAFAGLLSKCARHSGSCRCGNTRGEYGLVDSL